MIQQRPVLCIKIGHQEVVHILQWDPLIKAPIPQVLARLSLNRVDEF
jgi:hypothetical protein